MKRFILLMMVGLAAASCSSKPATEQAAQPKVLTPMTITSTAFADNELIPAQYTCDGESMNPPLSFHDVPQEAKSLALLVIDPDVPVSLRPSGQFEHWVVYNMPITTNGIEEHSTPAGQQGNNGTGKVGYFGPCPPDREHRYFFHLYALDTELSFESTPDTAAMQKAMEGHVMTEAELVGRYDRKH